MPVVANLAALEWGRRWVVDSKAVTAIVEEGTTGPTMIVDPLSSPLARTVGRLGLGPAEANVVSALAGDLVAYQGEAYAERFLDLLATAAALDHLC